MEKKPNKKEELSIVNNVLKLATKLMKVSMNLAVLFCSLDFPAEYELYVYVCECVFDHTVVLLSLLSVFFRVYPPAEPKHLSPNCFQV